jgi:transcriptional regulator with XRE-family HTH domain
MTSDAATKRAGDRQQDARGAAQEARRRWADAVLQALAEQRLSINAAAKEIGISPGRLQAWLHQDVEPSPRVMRDLARVIRRSHTHLLHLLDWLPPEMSDAPMRLEATEKLNEAIGEARRWLRGATRAVGIRGGLLVAGAMLEVSREWNATVRNSMRGQRYPTRYALRVGFHPAAEPPDPPTYAETARDRRHIEHAIFDTILRTSAHWLDPARLSGQDWAKRPDLVMTVPSLCASQPRGLRPNLLVPPSIVVVGIPHAGSQEVAALLANVLEWAYLDVRALAAEQFELGPDAPTTVVERAQVTAALRMLEDPSGIARQTVWSYSDPKPILQTFRQLGPDLPLVVLLRAPDSLLSYTTAQLAERDDPDVDLVEAAQNLVRRTVTQSRTPDQYLILDVPDLALGGSDPDEVDVVFDAYVDLAMQAATWLHQRHGAPALEDSDGILGQLWRSASQI